MDALRRLIATEPAVLVGVFVAVCSLAGYTLSDADQHALLTVLTFVLPIAGSLVVRGAVTPNAKVPDA